MSKINVALVGYGMSGREFHLPTLMNNSSYHVKLAQTRSEKNRNDLKALCPDVKIVSDYEEILADEEIDLVVITAPNDVHYSYTKDALLRGKHVVCEKPFVGRYEEALELFKLAEEKNLILRVFHNRKYDGDILTLKDLMKKRDFGKIVSFSTRFSRYRPEIGDNWRFKKTVMGGLFKKGKTFSTNTLTTFDMSILIRPIKWKDCKKELNKVAIFLNVALFLYGIMTSNSKKYFCKNQFIYGGF